MKKWIPCGAAAAMLCVGMLCSTPAQAVSLQQTTGKYDSALSASDNAALLPDSMDGMQAQQQLTRAQLSSFAVRLYASLNDMSYHTLLQETALKRMSCPFADTTDIDVQTAWALELTDDAEVFDPSALTNRQQTFTMLYRTVCKSGANVMLSVNETADTLFAYEDGAYVPNWAQTGTAYFMRQGLIGAYADNKIGVGEAVTAEEAAVMTYRAAAAVHTGRGLCSSTQEPDAIAMHSGSNAVSWTSCGAEYYLVYFYSTADFAGAPIQIEQVAADGVGAQKLTVPAELLEQPGLWYWSVDGYDSTGRLMASAGETAELTIAAQIASEGILELPQEEAEADSTAVISQSIPSGMANYAESYSDKLSRIFGTSSGARRYASQSEAAAHQATITVQLWNFDSNGNKITRNCSLTVNAALAETVQQIFAEIYAGGEQFPINSLGGYNWRGDNSTSEHCMGTAIDINPDANYMCTNTGAALTGTHWSPDTDAYSIPANGEVVAIFKKYGFGWGGDWNSKKDYMHFSYFGT